jgi:hypothetical protein
LDRGRYGLLETEPYFLADVLGFGGIARSAGKESD